MFIVCFGVFMARRTFKFEDEEREHAPGLVPFKFVLVPNLMDHAAPAHHICSAGEDDWDSISSVKSSTVVTSRILYHLFWPL